MKIEKRTIGPSQAEEMLRKNIKNRRVSERSLQKIIDQMKSGQWQEDTGETIKIAKDGTLLDGQHRLKGLIETNKTFSFVVVSDLPNKAFEVIDTGKSRCASDALHILGVKNYINVSSIIRGYLYLSDGKILNKQNLAIASNTSIVDTYNENPKYWDDLTGLSFTLYRSCSGILTQSFIGSYYALLSKTELEEAQVFFQKLCIGIGINDERDPIGVLRKLLIENRVSDKKLTLSAKNAFFVVTWNSFLQGKKYKNIPYRYGKDKFPDLYKTKIEASEALESKREEEEKLTPVGTVS